jgi:transposase
VLVETHYGKQLGWKVHRVTTVEVTEESVVCIDRLGKPRLRCSVCHRPCWKVHGWGRPREWRDLAFRDLPLRLRYRPRRVDCLRCGVGAWKTFLGPNRGRA